MKRLLLLVVVLTSGAPLFAQSSARYLVALKPSRSASKLHLVSNAAEAAAHNVRRFETVDLIGADLTPAEAEALRSSSDVAYVSQVVPRFTSDAAAAPLRPKAAATDSPYARWQAVPPGIDAVRARELWAVTRGDEVNIAIVDTGIDYHHPDLKGRYFGGYNVFTKSSDAMDDFGHGTHVAGILAADDNDFGVVGVAPEAHLWAVKVLDSRGSGTDETVAAGIDWVLARKRELGGNWVVNLSLGSEAASVAESQVFARAIDEGLLVVAAAGNMGTTDIEYPAAYPGVLAISALDLYNTLADFSTFGSGIAFSAPGVNVLSTVPLGSGKMASVRAGLMKASSALALSGSATGEVTAETIYCGFGKPEEFPSGVAGRIALIRRGEIFFRDKARNAINRGAVGVIIIPPIDEANRSNWTLLPETCSSSGCWTDPGDINFPWTIVLSTSPSDGDALLDRQGQPTTISYSIDDYASMSGTSMATPHVAGAAALVWSLAPSATASQIVLAMKLTAADLGPRGYDIRYGYGRIDAVMAARYVAPALFGLPALPPPFDGRRRSAGSGH